MGETDKPAIESRRDGNPAAHVGTYKAFYFAAGECRKFDLYDRGAILPGTTITGPAINQKPISMVVFHSDRQAEHDEFGHIFDA
ncbi:hypothetical protein [Halorarum halophilum]|uniref:hypothetical protein n=1 Tax=Halorarum halophilum TaxID=2743090 RepID=UPI003742D754